MGLSNEERVSEIYRSIDQIYSCVDKLRKAQGLQPFPYWVETHLNRVVTVADQLWYAFIGGRRHSHYWILGGDAESAVQGPAGPWSAAVISLCGEHRQDPSRPDELDKLPFDPFDSFLSISGLLKQSEGGAFREAVFDLYSWTESLAYALRRYHDNFLRDFSELDKTIADLQGACFSVFVRDEVFGRAYVLNRILEALYGGRYGKGDDLVRKAFLKQSLHHDFSRPMGPDGSLAECIEWDKWRLAHAPTPHNRVLLALRIAGRRFRHDSKFQELKTGLELVEPKPCWKTLKQEFEKNKVAYEAQEARIDDFTKAEASSGATAAVHGPEAYTWLIKKDRPKPAVEPDPPAE